MFISGFEQPLQIWLKSDNYPGLNETDDIPALDMLERATSCLVPGNTASWAKLPQM